MRERLIGLLLMSVVVPLALLGYVILCWVGLVGNNERGRAGVRALDHFVNATVFNGYAWESVSSHAWRERHRRWARVVIWVTDKFQQDHCRRANKREQPVVDLVLQKGLQKQTIFLMAVSRRCVCYLSGFDPSGPAHYHKLYREQAALQAGVTGDRVEVGARSKRSEQVAQWDVRFTPAAGGEPVQTEMRFWRWDDIIRAHWPRSGWRVAWDVARTTTLYVSNGGAWRILKASWPPFIALFAPGALLAAVFIGSPLLALRVGWLMHARTGSVGASMLAALIPVAALFGGLGCKARLNMQWLMRSFTFTARQARGDAPELEQRLDSFAQELVDTAREAAHDEILLVGHSSGAIMALAVLARALKLDPQLSVHGPRISLLTLGHCTPMLSSLPQAQRFRDELSTVARADGIDWIDFGAPPDGCSFPLCDPLRAAGLPSAPQVDRPKLLSPRFAALFSPGRYAELKRDRFHLHFQYLMATEIAGVYDYMAITAGSQTLAQRFADEPSVTDFTRFQLFGR